LVEIKERYYMQRDMIDDAKRAWGAKAISKLRISEMEMGLEKAKRN
jgi:hypothetical protein